MDSSYWSYPSIKLQSALYKPANSYKVLEEIAVSTPFRVQIDSLAKACGCENDRVTQDYLGLIF